MPTTLTESNTFTSAITVPASGEARTAASVDTPFQQITDRTKFLNNHVLPNGFMDGPAYIFVNAALPGVVVGPIPKLVIEDTALSQSIEQVVSYSSLSGVTGWRYLYAYKSGSSIAYEWSATGPTPDRVFQSGDSTRRFVLSQRFLSGSPTHYAWKERGKVTYNLDRAGYDVGPLTASTFTAASLAAFAPPHARIVIIQAALNAGENGATVYLRMGGSSGLGLPITSKAMTTPTTPNTYLSLDALVSDTQEIEYKLIDGGSDTPQFFINVLGYYE